MNVRADLHLHTIASDGRWSPQQLIEEVQQAGIGLFAVTDHDSLDSLAETAERVRGSGLRFLPGVELSARLGGQVYHLLAYGFRPDDPDLVALVEANCARLAGSGDEAVDLLSTNGYDLAAEEYAAYTWDRHRGGWKALNFLIDRGVCRDPRTYYELFNGDLILPQPDYPPPEEIVAVAHNAGGIVVLAHPGVLFYNGLDEGRLDELVEMGVEGLECYSYHHDGAATRRFLDYARSRDLLISGGSDCHGGFVGRPLGLPLVYSDDLRLGPLADRAIT